MNDNRPRKRLSQNFLHNAALAGKIVDALGIGPADSVIEIGPGKGALTEWILAGKPSRYRAVEIDARWVAFLNERFGNAIEVIHDDFLNTRWFEESGPRVKIIGNLPYHITSPILFHILDHFESVHSAVFMTQKEVARRISASAGNKDYGILSVSCQAYAEIRYLFTVGRGNFYPVPGVDSAVFRMQFYPRLENVENPELFRSIIRGTFNYRRKMMRNSLARIFDKTIVYSISAVTIDRRPEDLTVEEFKTLSNELNTRIRSSNA